MQDSLELAADRGTHAWIAVALAIAACASSATPPLPPDPVSQPAAERTAPAPDPATAVHVVRPGETLTGIAANYAVDVAHLAQANRLPDLDHIAVGQSLVVPVPPADGDRAEALVEQAAHDYRQARFDVALARAQRAEAILEAGLRRKPEHRDGLAARAAFITGCALAAFGENERAVAAFSRARAVYPEFEPPKGWLSPRLEKLYLAAQEP